MRMPGPLLPMSRRNAMNRLRSIGSLAARQCSMRTGDPAAPRSRRSPTQREQLAEALAGHLDLPFTVAGVLLVVVVVADNLTTAGSPLKQMWGIAGWVLWGLFVVEFVLCVVIAPSTSAFLRRNWWQLIFFAVPFFRGLHPHRPSRPCGVDVGARDTHGRQHPRRAHGLAHGDHDRHHPRGQ